ncbi:hypothetical protein GPECTOR_2g953 [Gonium pectorale]|uniref:Uncharacterized protein n=1 Tax=Gonium pectorale TaxID=33097 RepID=A0A150H1U7_GONPE|nr:hypothetical protein GPECTOR_2g953 [Gonium pectorale]|eukprot:KXZ56071.1 hypothetical protein GPECTOR_2g953 [Gonium pectorale]
MDGNFIADVRLDDSDEVLQLPIVKSKVKKLLQGAVKKIALLGAPVIPSSDDSLEQFLQSAGRFFGKDPAKWDQVGETKVDVTEEAGKRTTKLTGVFTGTELSLLVENPYYDERLPAREDKPELNFSQKRTLIRTDDEWQEVEAEDPVLSAEGAHGFWELAIKKEHHADFRIDRLAALLNRLSSPNMDVATTTAAAVWGLATTGLSRRALADLDIISLLITNLKRSLKMPVVLEDGGATTGGGGGVPEAGPAGGSGQLRDAASSVGGSSQGHGHSQSGTGNGNTSSSGRPPAGTVPEAQRNRYQAFLLGGLSVLLIDRNCRRAYLQQEPEFGTIFALAKNLEGYSPEAAAARREAASKLLTTMVQRDADARRSLIASGALRNVISLLNPKGPGESMIQFCAASLLATLVLDDDAMELIRDRGEAPLMFEACIVLLHSTLTKLKREVARFYGQLSEEEAAASPQFDVELGVRLAEAASQAMWGSAHYCVMMDPIQVKMEHIGQLGHMGMDCYNTVALPLSRVAHCITASIATLAANPDAAMLIMNSPDDIALKFMMAMLDAIETENFEQAGYVKASACAGVAFLACHPIGAEGDECMYGPFRTKLLNMGAFGALLRAALSSVLDSECDRIIQQAAALGLMYLSTMAGAVDSAELAMYAALLTDSDNSEMIEFLMAGMWILLRNGNNRKVLGTSFNPSPANQLAKNMINKLNDAITLHEINDEVAAKAAKLRGQGQGGGDNAAAASEQEQERGPASARSESVILDNGGNTATASSGGDADGGLAEGEEFGRDAGGSAGDADDAAAALEDTEELSLQAQQQQAEAAGEGQEPGPGDETAAIVAAEGDPSVAGLSAPGSALHSGVPSPRRGASDNPSGAASPAPGAGDGDAALAAGVADGLAEEGAEGDASLAPDADESYIHMEHVDMPKGEAFYEKRDKPFPSSMMLKRAESADRVRRKAEAMKGRMQQLEKRFDKQLKDNWGLETLVAVGESWLPAMLEQDEVGEANDVPVLKLFEFLVASICMFMVDDDGVPERRELDVFRLSAPDGVRNKTWWTMDVRAPEVEGIVDSDTERALRILVQILGMHLGAAWKSMQLGILTLWNACCRHPNMERHVVERGVMLKLLLIVNNPAWPPSLREIAGGCLEFFQERWTNLPMLGPGQGVPELLPQGLPAEVSGLPAGSQPTDGVVPFAAAMTGLVNTQVPLMEYRGCHGLARMTYTAPYGCPDPKAYLREAKAVAAALGGVEALIALMKRLNRRYQELGAPGVVLAAGLRSTSGTGSAPAPEDSGGASGGAGEPREENPIIFERDMHNMEAVQDIYFVAMAALLNLSVLKANQVPIAKRGLLVLLGTNTVFYNRVVALRAQLNATRPGAPSAAAGADSLAREEQLLHLCSAILQNISQHPQNRTRLYKAELKGSVALDKVIESATDVDDETRTAASFLPSIPSAHSASPSPIPSSTSVGMASSVGRGGKAGSSLGPSGSSVRIGAGSTGRGGRAPQKVTQNGQVINNSVDTVLAGTVRPKVVFPPICERGGAEANPSQRFVASPTLNRINSAGMHSVKSGEDNGSDTVEYNEAAGATMRHVAVTDSRYRFLTWIDNTFHDLDAGGNVPFSTTRKGGSAPPPTAAGAGAGDDGRSAAPSRATHRKPLWDENGDWLPNEPESFKALNKLLARPLSHLWQEMPEHRARQGRQRWEPVVSEYRELASDKPLTRPAAKLLSTAPPKDQDDLLMAATQLVGLTAEDSSVSSPPGSAGGVGGGIGSVAPAGVSGGGDDPNGFGAFGVGFNPGSAAPPPAQAAPAAPAPAAPKRAPPPPSSMASILAGEFSADIGKPIPSTISWTEGPPNRPSTRERENGRIGLTVLAAPHDMLVATAARRAAEAVAATEAPTFAGVPLDMASDHNGGQNGDTSPGRQVPLKVCLGPKRPRQVITFEDRIIVDNDATRPTLTLFEHVEGSRVSEGLFPSYILPNGKRAHMYYSGGALLDEVSVEAVIPPPRPSTVPQALQQTMPLANVLNLIAKPPGSAPPFIPYKPVPRLVPLPTLHTLTVKRPDQLIEEAFGDLREDNLQLVIQAKKIIKTQTTTRVENIEIKPQEEREPWTLPSSIFKNRVKECDARAFYDSHQVEERMFERDWQRACSKEKFTSMMSRENKANKEGKDEKVAIKEVHDVLLRYWAQVFGAYVYYAAGGTGDPYHMSLNAFTTFLDDCFIADPESQYCKRSDCDTIFIVCNFQPDKKSAEAAVNMENAMMRYEFLEAIVRLAIAKYGKGQATDDLATAVTMLIEKNIIPNLVSGALVNSNSFRTERLYNEEVDLVFKKHSVMLKALYSRYRLKPASGGLRPKVLKLDGWLQCMQDAQLIDSQFTLQDCALAFLWARMYVIDEIKDYPRYTCLSFTDFLEALGRVADMKALPSASDLDVAGYDTILEWAIDKERMEGGSALDSKGAGGDDGSGGAPVSSSLDIFRPRASAGYNTPKTRPLYVKVEMFLDLLFRRLYWDPSQPEVPFNYDGLLKLIKKIDKDLGP